MQHLMRVGMLFIASSMLGSTGNAGQDLDKRKWATGRKRRRVLALGRLIASRISGPPATSAHSARPLPESLKNVLS